ncbi:MAG TPA: glycosyltransferase family 9 protein [Terriglobales bacterium]|nr:glycosyltransferase family 9 protein [Terriglobales bacterium]
MSPAPKFVIVKLGAAGDVLLATALARALRQTIPDCRVGWVTTSYCAPLLEANPDLDGVCALESGLAAWRTLRRWQAQFADATVLLPHRSTRIALLLRASGWRRIIGWERGSDGARNWGLLRSVRFDLRSHRLQQLADLLAAADLPLTQPLAPRLHLQPDELRAGEEHWAGTTGARWVLAPGGARNPWSAMPNRVWAREQYLALAQRATANGIALRWIGGRDDADLCLALSAALPAGASRSLAGSLSMRQSAAAIACANLVIGNDSLPLVLAHALARPALGIYGPTPGARIHAPGAAFVQGCAGCGPCYDPRAGVRGVAYLCPRARCMEQISVDEVYRAAHREGQTQWIRMAHV